MYAVSLFRETSIHYTFLRDEPKYHRSLRTRNSTFVELEVAPCFGVGPQDFNSRNISRSIGRIDTIDGPIICSILHYHLNTSKVSIEVVCTEIIYFQDLEDFVAENFVDPAATEIVLAVDYARYP